MGYPCLHAFPDPFEKHDTLLPESSHAYLGKMLIARGRDDVGGVTRQNEVLGYFLLKKEKPVSGLHIVLTSFYSPICSNFAVCSSKTRASINSSSFPSRI